MQSSTIRLIGCCVLLSICWKPFIGTFSSDQTRDVFPTNRKPPFPGKMEKQGLDVLLLHSLTQLEQDEQSTLLRDVMSQIKKSLSPRPLHPRGLDKGGFDTLTGVSTFLVSKPKLFRTGIPCQTLFQDLCKLSVPERSNGCLQGSPHQ